MIPHCGLNLYFCSNDIDSLLMCIFRYIFYQVDSLCNCLFFCGIIFFLLTWIHLDILEQFALTCRYFTTDTTRPSREILEATQETGEILKDSTDLGKYCSLCCRKVSKACLHPFFTLPISLWMKSYTLPSHFLECSFENKDKY